MSSAKTIAKNTGFLFSAEIIDKLLSFFLVVVITRYLGSVGFGKYSFAFAFISLFTLFSHLGLNTYAFREISKDKSKTGEIINNAFTIKLFATIIIFIVAAIIAKSWPRANEMLPAIFLVMMHGIFEVFNLLTRIMFNAYEKTEFGLYAVIIEKILALSIGSYVLIGGHGLYVLLIALIASRVVTSIFYYIISCKKFVKISFSINLKLWKSLIKNSIPFWFTMMFQKIYYQIDKVMLSGFKGYAVTGWYSAASTLISALTFIPSVFIHATFPAMSKFYHENSKDSLNLLNKKTFYYLLAIGLPSTIGITMLSQRIILFIYKKAFIESSIVLQILSWSLLFIFLNQSMGYFLNSINKQHLFTISNGICAVANVVFNFALIPKFSYVGASIATVITQLINFCLLYYFTFKNKYHLNLIKVSYQPLISGVLMGFLIAYIKFLSIIYIIPIAAFFYFSMLFLIGGIKKEEINLIKSFFQRND